MLASKKQKVQTLSMPSQTPLFNYSFNIQGLKTFMEEVKMQSQQTQQRLSRLEKLIGEKIQLQNLNSLEKIIGVKIQALSQEIGKVNAKTQQLNEKKLSQDRKVDSKINQSFQRINERVQQSISSLSNTINQYFAENNKSQSNTQTELTNFITTTLQNITTLQTQLSTKISQNELMNGLSGSEQSLKKELASMLSGDQMKRMAALNQYGTKLKQTQKDMELQQKYLKQQIDEITHKVNKSLTMSIYEVQKHKIYQKLSEFRSSIDTLTKKNQQFVDFRKDSLSINQRNRQNFISLQEQIQKIKQKNGKFNKLENIGSVIQGLDPHLICQIGNTVKLHQKSIDKFQRLILEMQKDLDLKGGVGENMPTVNNGQNSDLMIKMIKEYMTNLDFDGRVRKAEKQIHDLAKKTDLVNDLDKKVQLMMKQIDMGSLMKQIKKKCDEENTRKDFRILDGKIQKMFQFYKMVRKDLDDWMKKSNKSTNERSDYASLTTKKLYGTNCISCEPSPISKTQRLSFPKNKINMSFEESLDILPSTSYLKSKK